MKLTAVLVTVCLLGVLLFLFHPDVGYAQTASCISIGDLDCSGTVDLADLTTLLSRFGQASPTADVDGSGTVNLPDLSILLSNFGQIVQQPSPSSTCYGMIQNIYSPDDPNITYLGRTLLKMNTQQNTLEYLILSGGYLSTNTVTIQLPTTSQVLPLSTQQGETLLYQGTVSYQENEEDQILNGDLRGNYIHIPFQINPAVNAYAYFGSNFTPTSCDTPLLPTSTTVPSITPTPPVVWMATHEAGTADEWSINENTAPAQDSNYCSRPLNGVSNEVAHTGQYSLKMMIDTNVSHAGCRTFRYPEIQSGNAYYYSAWFYFPENYIVYGEDPSGTTVSGWTNLVQFKTRRFGQTGGSNVAWSWGISNRPDGTMYLVTKWADDMGVPGPSIDYILLPVEPRQFHQDSMNVPPRQWFHLEIFLRQNTLANYDGRITVWQDGVQIFDMNNVITRHPYTNPFQPSTNSWSMNSYGGFVEGQANILNSLYPRAYTVFVDDVAVSTQRLYPLLNP